MTSKVVLMILDGLGDRPIAEFGGLTPLEKAETKNLDKLVASGITGTMNACGFGVRPGSDTSHMAILGYDPKEHYHGRGAFEVAGIGMDFQPGDIAFRGNMGTVDEDLKVVDRRAGRIDDTSPFAKLVDGIKIEDVEFRVKAGTGHRMGIIMRGVGLSSNITDADPHKVDERVHQVKPEDNSPEAAKTARALNAFLLQTHELFADHELNKKRLKENKPAANFILVRGAGYVAEIPTFEERWGFKAACIAGGGLYKGVARLLGFDLIDVKGATGKANTDVDAKFAATLVALEKYDFVFLHIKGTDDYSHDGDFNGKKEFIEKVDKAAAKLVERKDTLIIVTGDHSTPCALKDHSGDPTPLLMSGVGVRVDQNKEFGERNCAQGGLGRIIGLNLMPEIQNILGKAELYGD
ncbi:MAG: 2,3-bisphosphoglycerate-independent phosphoglycerate mutase [Candidatus Altiarchaeota archaeon]